MILPDLKIEKEIFGQEDCFIIGIDEAGRGPLAGPVVAGAVWIDPAVYDEEYDGKTLIRDSKLLSHKQREAAFEMIKAHEGFVFGIGEVSHEIIDRINILNATFLAMRFALEEVLDQLEAKCGAEDIAGKACLLLDGNRKIPKITHEQKIFPRGDKHIFSIAAASICAKVYRDRLMDKYHEQYPVYGFDQHRGYGTQLHMECLKKNGPCDIHRKSFAPVASCLVD